jgi:hypothetical protein
MKDPNEFLTIIDVMMNKYPGQVDDTVWFGEDLNENGVLDPNEDDGEESPPYDDADGVLDHGIRDFVTVDSGTASVNPNTASPEVLQIMMPERYQDVLEQRQLGKVQGSSTTAFRIRSYGHANGYTHVMEWVVRMTGGGYPTVLRTRSL